MKKNKQTKRNNKKILTSVLLVAFALLMVFGALMISPLKASAATNRAGVYTISGTYNIGDGNKSGYLSDFRITIATQYFTDDSATVAQTKYHDHTYCKIKSHIEVAEFCTPTKPIGVYKFD